MQMFTVSWTISMQIPPRTPRARHLKSSVILNPWQSIFQLRIATPERPMRLTCSIAHWAPPMTSVTAIRLLRRELPVPVRTE